MRVLRTSLNEQMFFLNAPSCLAEVKSIKTEPGEVTSPPHTSNKKDEGMKRDRESQEINDSDEDDDEEEEEGDLLEEEEVRLKFTYFVLCFVFNCMSDKAVSNITCSSFGCLLHIKLSTSSLPVFLHCPIKAKK